jgi:O-antigen/teichoic acid export membrane protein
MIVSLFVMSIIVKYLGKYDYGLLNYGTAYIMIFLNISSLGMDGILVFEIVKGEIKAGELIGTALFMRFASSIISLLSIFGIIYILNYGEKILIIITLIQSVSLLFSIFDILKYWFQTNLNSKFVIIAKLYAFIIISIFRLVLVYLKADTYLFAIAVIIEAALTALFIYYIYKKHGGPKIKIKVNLISVILKKSYVFLIAGLLFSVYTQIDRIMLGKMVGLSEVGIYTAGMNIAGVWTFIPLAVIESLRPIIMKEKYVSEVKYLDLYTRLNTVIIWVSLFFAIIMSLFAKTIIVIVFGNEFINSSIILVILTCSKIFSMLGITRTIWLLSENRKKYINILVGVGAICNIIINYILIPIYGAKGAALATLLTEFIASFLILFFISETRNLGKLLFKSFINPLIRNKKS